MDVTDNSTAVVSFISLRDAVGARNAMNGQMIGSAVVKVDYTRVCMMHPEEHGL
jgi:hypothetical protein